MKKLIIQALKLMIGFYTVVIVGYLFRHYIFTFTALRKSDNSCSDDFEDHLYEPTVSIVIPARNEEKVIGQLLQRMTELTWSYGEAKGGHSHKYASSDILDKLPKNILNYSFIRVIHRDKKTGERQASDKLLLAPTDRCNRCFSMQIIFPR
jgi:cellulose synthase/poly-beta-1,6-N-acetylglucosamine synthase-like glycosyltransferase